MLGENIKKLGKLGFGLMRLPKNGDVIDVEQTKKMVDLFMDAGFTYFDTAWAYAGSEDAIRQALVERYPRESYQLATKNAAWINCKTKEEAQAQFDTSLKQTGAGYFDFYLLHNLGEARTHYFDDFDMWNWVQEKKAAGLIKHVGFSFHSTPEELEEILKAHPEMEFVQLQINYLDWEDEKIQSRKCYEVCVKHQKPVIVMEPIKGGRLAGLPEEAERLLKAKEPESSIASWAVRYAASLENVMVVLSGMSTPEQVADNVAYMQDFQPLNEEEHALVEQAAEITRKSITIGCTSCRYCTDGCPQSIPIPSLFTVYNDYRRFAALGKAQYVTEYKWATDKAGKASDCIGCRQCEEHCPQHLEITEWLKTIAETFE